MEDKRGRIKQDRIVNGDKQSLGLFLMNTFYFRACFGQQHLNWHKRKSKKEADDPLKLAIKTKKN